MMGSSLKQTIFLVFITLGYICLAQEAVSPEAYEIASKCSEYWLGNLSSAVTVPRNCCQDFTGQCYKEHNGEAKFKWMTGQCDYTIDVVKSSAFPTWFCTCCGSCTEQNTNSQCKAGGGRCRRNCSRTSEFHAWWIPCQHDTCKCCVRNCYETRCANNLGYCSPSGKCKKGYRANATEHCRGQFGCTCCVPCGERQPCE